MQSNARTNHLPAFSRPDVPDAPSQKDDEPEFPNAGDPYQPWSRPSAKPEFSLDFIMPDGKMEGFSYIHLDRRTYEPGRITLTFAGMEPMKVIITGRNLDPLNRLLRAHRCVWVQQAVRDFGQDDKDGFISSIAMEAIEQD